MTEYRKNLISEYLKRKGMKCGLIAEDGIFYYLFEQKYCKAECLRLSLQWPDVYIECSDGIISPKVKIALLQQGEGLEVYYNEMQIKPEMLEIFVLLRIRYDVNAEDYLYKVFYKKSGGKCLDASFTNETMCSLFLELYSRNLKPTCNEVYEEFHELSEKINKESLKAAMEVYIQGEDIVDLIKPKKETC